MNKPELYLDNGYINMPDIIDLKYPFTFVTGARRTGKTYGGLKFNLKNKLKFVYLRRTQTEIDVCKNEKMNPFRSIDKDITVKSLVKGVIGFMKDDELIAPGLALTTLHHVRGISGEDYDQIFYDEFIPEKIARPIKGEFDAWANCYETLNANRELQGKDPMQFLCLANSNAAANPIFMGLGLVTVLEKIKREKRCFWSDDRRGILIVNAENSPISEKKKQTALGKLTVGTDFASMAYENEYAFDDWSNIESRTLKEYRPEVTVGEITIYRHKGRREYYVTQHMAGSPVVYGINEREIEAFSRSANKYRNAYLDGVMWFENYLAKILFIQYTK